jgi:uncharacterized protein YkwD
MQKVTRKDLRFLAVVLASLVLACSGIEASRKGATTVTEGNFAPKRAGAANYGPDPGLSCPAGGRAVSAASTDLETRAKQNRQPVPQADGRLCAMAETMLGWTGEPPGEHVVSFLSSYFGLTASVPAVLITTVETTDASLIGARVVDPIAKFSQNTVQPRFGLAIQRLSGGRADASKLVLLMQDLQVDIQPIPRQLAANSQAMLRGQLVDGYQNPKAFITDPTGHLESPSIPPGKEFQTEIRCADKPGTIRVEVRGELNGAESILANFPIACGTEPPTSVALGKPAAVGDLPQQERKLFQLINDERTKAGLPALEWDDAVAGIARSISEQRRDQLKGGGGAVSVDIVGRLKSEGIQSPVVLSNPAAARSPEEAQERFSASPVHRANFMSTEVTHVGVGATSATDPAGRPITLYTELFVRELAPANVEEIRAKLRAAMAQKRKDARAGPLQNDKTLQEVAQKYADELAAAKGSLPKAQQEELLKPLQSQFGPINVVAGAKADPLEFAEEPIVVGGGNLVGIGVALGLHPNLGKNAPYVVEIVSSPPKGSKGPASTTKKRPKR